MANVYADSWWINCNEESLIDGSCTQQVNETLGVKPTNKELSTFVPDAFAGITLFIGTVVFGALIYSWILLIIGGANEQMITRWKEGVKYSIIWLILVWLSYGIIRMIQLVVAP